MNASLRQGLLLGLVALAALWLRTHDLGARPMHADEANQAVKLGALLDTGHYAFDPHDHHGPTLYYFALLPAWLRGETSLAALTETTVRLTPACFGVLAVLLTAALAAPLGHRPALVAAALVAASPAAVYYSRYFIQETLLAAFTLGALACAHRWWRRGSWGWALGTGVFAGLMFATKTSALFFGLAALLAFAWAVPAERRRLPAHGGLALAAAGAVAALFYSSFLTHPAGLRDALLGVAPMLGRASGGGGHDKPWWYFAHLFVFHRAGGYGWGQSLFLVAAVAGGLVAWRSPSPLGRGLAGFAALGLLGLSATPYKTPWGVVQLVPAGAILAGLAADALARRPRWGLAAAGLLGLALLAESAWQTRRTVFQLPADPRNPFAYVHTSPDVPRLRALAAAARARAPAAPIRIISEEYWPLPWYLRGDPAVGYWSEAPANCDGALIVASLRCANAVRERLRGEYRESYLGLRPNVLLVVFEPAPAPPPAP